MQSRYRQSKTITLTNFRNVIKGALFSSFLLGCIASTSISHSAFSQETTAATQTSESVSPWLIMPGNPSKLPDGLTKPKKVVLVSGDDEYRSEEALPMLAKILSEQHGFDTVVLFAINPETGTVDPNYQKNIPGLEHLSDADVAILFIRFRQLPDDQMQHFADFAKRGGSMIALRTATHPFNFPANSESPFASWSWNSKTWPGGFGQQLLGETWHSHHGKHKSESARGVILDTAKANPILRGVTDLWAPSDVYGVVHLPSTANVLVQGQVLKGMKPDDAPVEDGRNDPMMPMVWTKDYQLEDGKIGKVFCSTMCSAVDLLSEDLRRLIVNATFWAADLENQIPEKASVNISENYKPSMFGFQKEPNFFKDQKIQPKDFVQ